MIWKEFCALAPTWLAIAVAIVAAVYGPAAVTGRGSTFYSIGAITLGAQALGHEYSHRTLSLLLAQPVARERILLVKLGVLAVFLAALVALAAIGLSFFRLKQSQFAAV